MREEKRRASEIINFCITINNLLSSAGLWLTRSGGIDSNNSMRPSAIKHLASNGFTCSSQCRTEEDVMSLNFTKPGPR